MADLSYRTRFIRIYVGYAGTNNPLEQFNRILKSEVSQWTRMVLTTFVDTLFSFIQHTVSPMLVETPFSHTPIVSQRLSQRAVQMVRSGRLSTNLINNNVIQMRLTDMQGQDLDVGVESRSILSEIQRYQKVEMRNMPEEGWTASINPNQCQCLLYYKNGICVHILALLMRHNIQFNYWTPPKRMLVNQFQQRASTRAATRARNRRGLRGGRAVRGNRGALMY